MGSIELNPIIRFVLQFGTPYFLVLKVVHMLVMIAIGMTLNRILQKINLVFGWAPRGDIILAIWTFLLLMPVTWNSYWLYIWRL